MSQNKIEKHPKVSRKALITTMQNMVAEVSRNVAKDPKKAKEAFEAALDPITRSLAILASTQLPPAETLKAKIDQLVVVIDEIDSAKEGVPDLFDELRDFIDEYPALRRVLGDEPVKKISDKLDELMNAIRDVSITDSLDAIDELKDKIYPLYGKKIMGRSSHAKVKVAKRRTKRKTPGV